MSGWSTAQRQKWMFFWLATSVVSVSCNLWFSEARCLLFQSRVTSQSQPLQSSRSVRLTNCLLPSWPLTFAAQAAASTSSEVLTFRVFSEYTWYHYFESSSFPVAFSSTEPAQILSLTWLNACLIELSNGFLLPRHYSQDQWLSINLPRQDSHNGCGCCSYQSKNASRLVCEMCAALGCSTA